MVIWFTNTTGKKWLMDIDMNQIFNSFSYFSLDSETRSLRETFNPMCEVFPNVRKNSKSCWFSLTYFFKHQVAACNWWRWGKDGGQELKNLICILGNNIINQKVKHLCHFSCDLKHTWHVQLFALLWVWHCVLVPVGVIRILTRLFQLCSPHLRWQNIYLMKLNIESGA